MEQFSVGDWAVVRHSLFYRNKKNEVMRLRSVGRHHAGGERHAEPVLLLGEDLTPLGFEASGKTYVYQKDKTKVKICLHNINPSISISNRCGEATRYYKYINVHNLQHLLREYGEEALEQEINIVR